MKADKCTSGDCINSMTWRSEHKWYVSLPDRNLFLCSLLELGGIDPAEQVGNSCAKKKMDNNQ